MTDRDLSAFAKRAVRDVTPPPRPRPARRPTPIEGDPAPPARPEPASPPEPGRGHDTSSPRAAVKTRKKGTSQASTNGGREQEPKRAVMAWIPVRLHELLNEAAEQRGVYKTDVILSAFGSHHASLRERLVQPAPAGPLPPRGRRRRKSVAASTQCVMYITEQERRVIDDLALELGVSRAELVSDLLALELEDRPG